MTKETYLYGIRDLLTWQIIWQKRPVHGKRDLIMLKKRPTYMAKETCGLDFKLAFFYDKFLDRGQKKKRERDLHR